MVRGDSTALVERVKSKDKNVQYTKGDTVGWLHNGDTVVIAAADSGFAECCSDLVTVTVGGKKGFLDGQDLMFGDNADGRGDWVNSSKMSRQMHSDVGHLYMGGFTVYWIILGLLALALLFAAIGRHKVVLLLASLALLAAMAIEVYGFFLFKNDLMWWLDKEYYSFWMRMLHMLVFVVAVAMHVGSVYLINTRFDGDGFAAWIPALAYLVAVIIDFILMVVLGLFHVSNGVADTVTYIVAAVCALVALIVALTSQIREAGGFGGTILALFSMLWGVGLLVTVVMLFVAVIKVFWTLILIVVGVILMLAIGRGSAGTSYVYKDSHGKIHNTRREAEDANEHYANRIFLGDLFDLWFSTKISL